MMSVVAACAPTAANSQVRLCHIIAPLLEPGLPREHLTFSLIQAALIRITTF